MDQYFKNLIRHCLLYADFRDAIMINLVSFFTSLYAGFAVFSIIGYMAHEQGLEIEKVIDSGRSMRFICGSKLNSRRK